MPGSKRIAGTALAALLVAVPAGEAYERQLNARAIREAYFLGKDDSFRSERFLKDYVETFPVPKQGVHVARIELVTPFKYVVNRARKSPDGYSPLQAEEDYKSQPPRLTVKVRLSLTPTFPAHSLYTIPAYGPIIFRDPDFGRDFDIHLVQRGDIEPVARDARPIYSCGVDSGCLLVGAVLTAEFDPEQVASRPARVYVFAPDGQQVEAEFDLGRLR